MSIAHQPYLRCLSALLSEVCELNLYIITGADVRKLWYQGGPEDLTCIQMQAWQMFRDKNSNCKNFGSKKTQLTSTWWRVSTQKNLNCFFICRLSMRDTARNTIDNMKFVSKVIHFPHKAHNLVLNQIFQGSYSEGIHGFNHLLSIEEQIPKIYGVLVSCNKKLIQIV